MKLNSPQLEKVDPHRRTGRPVAPQCGGCGQKFETVTQKVRHKCPSKDS